MHLSRTWRLLVSACDPTRAMLAISRPDGMMPCCVVLSVGHHCPNSSIWCG